MSERKKVQFSIATVMAMVLCAAVILALFRETGAHAVGVLAILVIIVLCAVPFYLIGLFLLIRQLFRWVRPLRPRRRHVSITSQTSPMRLSRDEELFLRHWMYDEVHYEEGPGPAKRLQVQHRAIPGELAILIAAAIPDPLEQERAGLDRPSAEPPQWPWSEVSLRARISEARAALSADAMSQPPVDRPHPRPRP